MQVFPTGAQFSFALLTCYRVEGPDEPETVFFTTRREAAREARLRSLACGEAHWTDPLTGETFPYFDGRPCTCSAETRLLRAIFGESHPGDGQCVVS